ncbi:recombinase family protein [Phenylobacterium sp.]|jgi:DNA invertase Pin-like site-specific DNA recombinase|uniref:recombinase family protein n=1 Tax=Phenylobacterium sp. TaxID=1871053 RepID=UPI000C8DC11F|nr:recombinase family protein [Phenylobacterium sp.]MAK81843.1 resolvase [Phenylobacterium sp.]MCA6240036.1 recombinase family protein [Phenylobacterium sp.]|tara:strand:+ start:59155 stop:59739 length:585 start_codon:yes stop_codon:yes gene_type:complete
MLLGYARVSTDDQDLALQRASLKDAGCRKIFEEKVSGAKRARAELDRLLEHLRDGDVVVVSRLDRLARSTRDLLTLAEEIADRGAGLRSLAEPWADTTSAAGKMVLTVFAGIAEFERSLILQRTGAGRVAAQARGVRFGRPSKISDEQWAHYGPLLRSSALSVPSAAKLIGCGRATLYRRLARDEAEGAEAPPC